MANLSFSSVDDHSSSLMDNGPDHSLNNQLDVTKTQLTISGANLDMSDSYEKVPDLRVVDSLRPSQNSELESSKSCKLKILHLREVPLECNYEIIHETFKEFGNINEI